MPPGKYIRTPESNEKNRQSNLGRKDSPETKEKKRLANLKRYENPLEHEKSRQASLKLYEDPLSHKKSSEAQQKHYKENPERKEKISKTLKIVKNTPEQKERNRKSQLIAQNRPEVLEKQRKARIKQVEKNYGIAHPNYNLSASEYFKSFDLKHNTHGRYAVYGNGEYLISDLGYFPDYINFDKKLIIEWDEEHHFDENGNLCERDVQRQKEIQEHFPDFEFKRIREKDLST